MGPKAGEVMYITYYKTVRSVPLMPPSRTDMSAPSQQHGTPERNPGEALGD